MFVKIHMTILCDIILWTLGGQRFIGGSNLAMGDRKKIELHSCVFAGTVGYEMKSRRGYFGTIYGSNLWMEIKSVGGIDQFMHSDLDVCVIHAIIMYMAYIIIKDNSIVG